MPAKKSPNAKIIDISAPDQTSPDPTSRPVVVTNRPVLTNDPMMVDETSHEPTPGLPTAPIVSRQAKTISPITAEEAETNVTVTKPAPAADVSTALKEADGPLVPDDEEASNNEPEDTVQPTEEATAPKAKESDTQAGSAPEVAEEEKHDEQAQPTPAATQAEPEPAPTEEEVQARHDATDAKELEVDTARQKELEELIASEKYVVPINAVERKRARFITITLTVLAVVLAVVLFDIALDSNAFSVPGVPHTNFFSVK